MSKRNQNETLISEKRVSRIAWIVWAVFIAAYLAMNALFIFGGRKPTPEILLGWGIGLPILTNLCWWGIAFRLRHRIRVWWAFGICTAAVVGIAGFLSMLAISQMMSGG